MRLIMVCLLGLLAAAAPLPGAQAAYDLSWWTVDGGGATFITGGTFQIGGTIGQPDAGVLTGGTYQIVGGFWAVSIASCPGDCDCNGVVNFGDINPFVAVLSGGTPCNFENCDIDGNGVINFGDINPFVAILSGGGGPCP